MRNSLLIRSLLLILVLGLGACANGDDGVMTCNKDNCEGCCKGNLCIEDTDKSSCGSGGEECEICDTGETCSSSGSCVKGESECDKDNPCEDECCKNGRCYTGTTRTACGGAGETCVDCTAKDKTCDAVKRECTDAECKPNCVGKCEGGDDGCDGTCEDNGCKGCCTDTKKCITKTTDAACGKDGGKCVECDCEDGECKDCTKKCTGKCKGDSDLCGGSCPGDCDGCCNEDKECKTGTDNKICGGSGNTCKDCTEDGETCDSKACTGCEPVCDNKCKGETDGCKDTCSVDKCPGCCNKSGNCVKTATDTACGKDAEDCEICQADFEGWSWKCDTSAGDCVKDQQLGTSCTGKDGGTTSCTDNNEDGKCWEETCCTGCWDKGLDVCYTSYWDDDCGKDGSECVDCTTSNKVCRDGACTNPNPNSCDTEWASCTDIGGLPGTCINGTCCSGCYYFDWIVWACQNVPNDAACGIDGEECEECDSDWGGCVDGACEYPF